jgi:hypothetical protein
MPARMRPLGRRPVYFPQVFGYGGHFSGDVKPGWFGWNKDDILFSAVVGEAIGNYSTGGWSLAVPLATNLDAAFPFWQPTAGVAHDFWRVCWPRCARASARLTVASCRDHSPSPPAIGESDPGDQTVGATLLHCLTAEVVAPCPVHFKERPRFAPGRRRAGLDKAPTLEIPAPPPPTPGKMGTDLSAARRGRSRERRSRRRGSRSRFPGSGMITGSCRRSVLPPTLAACPAPPVRRRQGIVRLPWPAARCDGAAAPD